ncbi:MAG: amidase [Myxococcota bacterium]
MDTLELPWLSIEALRTAIEQGELSAREVTDLFLARIERVDPQVGSYVEVWSDRARAAAARLDARQRTGGSLGPLHGVPIAIKDLCDVRGEPTRAGTCVLGDAPARQTACVVERLEAAGAVLLGRTKMTEGGFVAHHASVRPPRNPWRPNRWTGISSSGSGAALAAGLCTGALGTDTGGSIRFPSAACGLTGLKPTHGRIPLHGISPFAPSLDTVGPMARSVEDVATLYSVMAGRDPRDGWSMSAEVAAPQPGPVEPNSRRVRIGIDEAFAGVIAQRDILDLFQGGLKDLRRIDAVLTPFRLPDCGELHQVWITIASAELARSHAATYPARADAYGPALRGAIEVGRAQSGAAVARAWQVRQEWTNRLEACFEQVDVIVAPVFARPLGSDTDLLDERTFPEAATAVRVATPFSLSGSPVLVLPCGIDSGGVPYAMQLIGPRHGEARLLALAQAYQNATRWHAAHPSGFRADADPVAPSSRDRTLLLADVMTRRSERRQPPRAC